MLTIDTNILIYAFDERDPVKHRIAQYIVTMAANTAVLLSNQVFGETYRVLTRRLKRTPAEAAKTVRNLMTTFQSVPATRSAFESAIGEASTGVLSFWDAVILASASEAGCKVCLSEDMQDGYRFGPIEVVNPFGPSGLTERAAKLLSPAT